MHHFPIDTGHRCKSGLSPPTIEATDMSLVSCLSPQPAGCLNGCYDSQQQHRRVGGGGGGGFVTKLLLAEAQRAE